MVIIIISFKDYEVTLLLVIQLNLTEKVFPVVLPIIKNDHVYRGDVEQGVLLEKAIQHDERFLRVLTDSFTEVWIHESTIRGLQHIKL